MRDHGGLMRSTAEILFLRILAKEPPQLIFTLMQTFQLGPDLGQLIRGVKGHILRRATRVAGLRQDKRGSGQWGANLFHETSMGLVWLKPV